MNEQKRTFQDIYLLLVSFFQQTKLLLFLFYVKGSSNYNNLVGFFLFVKKKIQMMKN